MNKIKIQNKIISKNSPVFIIAEIGINHNGDINLAKKMITAAKQAGADAVKFQTYKTELFINKKYASEQFKVLKKYELAFEDFYKLKKFADRHDIIFISSPFDVESLNFLLEIKTPAIKIASSELSDLPLIISASKSKIPLIISTGLHTEKEMDAVIKYIKEINKKLILLHCVSDYPLNTENANLMSIQYLANRYKLLTGFSDHSATEFLDIIAVSLGAKVIEKHFTLNKKLKGADHKISTDPKGFKTLVTKIRETEKALGLYKKVLSTNEKNIRKYALKSIFAKTDIKKGEKFSAKNIITQRPLIKSSALKYNSILNKTSKRNITKNDAV